MNAIKILEAWNTSIRNKSEYPLRHFLPKDCKIEYFERPQTRSKEEYLICCRDNAEAKCIGDFQIIYDNDGVCCGSRSVTYSSGKFGLVMFFGQYSTVGVTSWTSLVSRDAY